MHSLSGYMPYHTCPLKLTLSEIRTPPTLRLEIDGCVDGSLSMKLYGVGCLNVGAAAANVSSATKKTCECILLCCCWSVDSMV